jgi:predicted dehydrogenase
MRARDAGGVLLTQAVHTLDLLLDLVGPAASVAAQCRTSKLRPIDTEDVACAAVTYANGAIGVIDATTVAYPGYPERIEIAGTRGSALIEAEKLTVHRHDAPVLEIAGSASGGGGADPMAFSHEPHKRLIEEFLDAVSAGRPPRVTGRSALAVHALIDAMLESSRTRAAIAMPNVR